MPEETTRAGEMTEGFWIRRVGPAAVTAPRRLARGNVAAVGGESNKENVSPLGLAAVGPTWRRRSTRKSPLPVWYPRTPLRDITAIVNALERRRFLLLAARARAARIERDSEAIPQNAILMSPLSQELMSVSNQSLSVGTSTPEPAPTCTTSFLSPVEHPLQMSSASSSFSPTDDSPTQISSFSNDLTPKNQQKTVDEEKLCSSIDQIEKLVMKNLKAKKEPVAKRATQRRTLMSMR